jgi:hypothetical protein
MCKGMAKLAGADTTLFGDVDLATGGVTALTPGFLTEDKETSGVIDVTDFLDRKDEKSTAC